MILLRWPLKIFLRAFLFLGSFLCKRTRIGRFVLLSDSCTPQPTPDFTTVMAGVLEQLRQVSPEHFEYLEKNGRLILEVRGGLQAMEKRGYGHLAVFFNPWSRFLIVQSDLVLKEDLPLEDQTTLLASEFYASIEWYRSHESGQAATLEISDDQKFWQYLETQIDYLERCSNLSLDTRPILAFYGESYFDLLQKMASGVTKVDGIEIASCGDSSKLASQFRSTATQALRLLRDRDPRRHQRVVRYLKRIYLCPLFSLGLYQHESQLCLVHFSRLVEYYGSDCGSDREQLAIRLAGVLVHEATHGRLLSLGIEYEGDARARSEEICFAEEGRALLRLSHEESNEDLELPKFDLETYEISWARNLPDMIRLCYQAAQRVAEQQPATQTHALPLPLAANEGDITQVGSPQVGSVVPSLPST